jgi:predicted aldo/keto reductase-like oxidoreductase
MRYRNLGSSDLKVSEISLGAWLTYAGGIELEQTRACTEAAFDAGINFFDTAMEAVDPALGDVAVMAPTLAPFAREGVKHR